MRAGLTLLMAAWAAAAEPAWDWLPRAADDDRVCEVHLTAAAGWSAATAPGLEAMRDGDQLILRFLPRTTPSPTVLGPDAQRLGLRLVAPGGGAGLEADADGRLHLGGDAAILAVPRREAAADRRWAILRRVAPPQAVRCAHRLVATEPAAEGLPALTAQIAAAQAMSPIGGGVLVELSGADRLAAWKHREYRQALAWLVADLAARGATAIVLVEPTCPAVEEPLLAALRTQVRDVARAYRCTAIDTIALGDHRLWERAPGIIGGQPNEAGRTRREALLAPWLER